MTNQEWQAAKDVAGSDHTANWVTMNPDQAAAMIRALVFDLRHAKGEVQIPAM